LQCLRAVLLCRVVCFFFPLWPLARATLSPYTTLFRSRYGSSGLGRGAIRLGDHHGNLRTNPLALHALASFIVGWLTLGANEAQAVVSHPAHQLGWIFKRLKRSLNLVVQQVHPQSV